MEATLARGTRFGLFFTILAMLLVGIVISTPGADAAPNNGTNKKAHQLRGENFAEGCGNAGGKATTL